jgi:hypothetical protein
MNLPEDKYDITVNPDDSLMQSVLLVYAGACGCMIGSDDFVKSPERHRAFEALISFMPVDGSKADRDSVDFTTPRKAHDYLLSMGAKWTK